MRFTLYTDIIDHRDINILSFHNNQDINFIINVYSDSNQTAIKTLWDNIRDIGNMIIMTGDFNIRDSNWDPNIQYHSIHTEDLLTIADSLGLELLPPSNPGPTRFADNRQNTNSVLDLVFIAPNNSGYGKYTIYPEICFPSDHVPLTIKVGIKKENIDIVIQFIKRDSNKEKEFIEDIRTSIRTLDTTALASQTKL